MNRIAMAAIAASLAFSYPAFVDDVHHPEKVAEPVTAKGQVPGSQAPAESAQSHQQSTR
ncbi:MAG: hypothetical protein AAB319_06585 [Pseudomonadota bacterium]